MADSRLLAGKLRYRIKIYNRVITTNEYGEGEESLSLYKSVRAERRYLGGYVRKEDEQMSPGVTIEFQIRFDENINEQMYIRYNDDLYRVRYVYHTYEMTTTIKCTLDKDNKV